MRIFQKMLDQEDHFYTTQDSKYLNKNISFKKQINFLVKKVQSLKYNNNINNNNNNSNNNNSNNNSNSRMRKIKYKNYILYREKILVI